MYYESSGEFIVRSSSILYRLDHKLLVGIESDPRSEPSRFPIECLPDPFDVLM